MKRQEFKQRDLDRYEERKLTEHDGHIAWQHLEPIQIAQLLRFRPELRGEYERRIGKPVGGELKCQSH